MAFEGDVKDFGLSEIFQLISLQQKSGLLSISGKDHVAVFFRDGTVISTRDRRNRARDPLKDYLLRYGFIGRTEMNNLQQIQAETNLDLTDILVSEKYFSEDELKLIFSEQIQETIQDVLSWPKSHYKFIMGKQMLKGVKFYTSIQVDGLLMESMRRIDELPELKRIFPEDGIVLRRLNMPVENPPPLSKYEEFMFELLDRDRSIDWLISQARMPMFCTYEALKNLLEKELLEIIEESRPSMSVQRDEVLRNEVARRGRFAPAFAAVIILIASFTIGEYVVPAIAGSGWNYRTLTGLIDPLARPEAIGSPSLKRIENAQMEESIREGLEQYKASKGSYPFILEILAARKIVPGDLVEMADRAGLEYNPEKDGFSYELRWSRRNR